VRVFVLEPGGSVDVSGPPARSGVSAR
jgi:hypothetical protein